MLKLIPKEFFQPDGSGVLRILEEDEWRGIGITQSLGWQHYEVHAPEPHVLLFRRAIEKPVKPAGKRK
jgi:cyclin-dependent kinase regulatory subunit CKS1